MKKILLALTILLTVFLVGCENQNTKLTVRQWAVKYAVEYVIEEHGDGDYMINIEDYEYYYVDGTYTRGLFGDEEYAYAVYKVTVTYLGDVYEGTYYIVYVGISWDYDYTALDLNTGVSVIDKRFSEEKIIDVDIEGGE